MNKWETFDNVADVLTKAEYVFDGKGKRTAYYHADSLNGKTIDYLKDYFKAEGTYDTFCGSWSNFIYINGWKYWISGNTVNKAKMHDDAPYDYIADEYDTLFSDVYSKEEDMEVIDMIDYDSTESILDIGCGTGLFLEYENPRTDLYLGIDVSERMLWHFNKRHGRYNAIQTKFEHFYSPKKFDKIIAMYGVFSYIDGEYLSKVVHYLEPNGKAFLMLYADDYHPVTYEKTGIEFDRVRYNLNNLSGWTVTRYHGYDIAEYVKGEGSHESN